MIIPPSTGMTCPVTIFESSDASHTAVPVRSSGSSARWIAIWKLTIISRMYSGTPCYPTAGGGAIVRTGKTDPPAPVWPDPMYPKTSTGGILVTTFCEAATGVGTIDSVTGLPGPGALILPGKQTLLKTP